jgi:hypothetical protein
MMLMSEIVVVGRIKTQTPNSLNSRIFLKEEVVHVEMSLVRNNDRESYCIEENNLSTNK